jgi:glycosyltransferase involved in cell wall biosynthesis
MTELRIDSDHVALVHDYLLVLRGAERTFAAISDLWPGAPVYTLLYDASGTEHRFAEHPVTASALQRTGMGQNGFRKLLPLFPIVAERLPVQGHRLVVSSSSAFAHGVRPDPAAVHVCYCHTPFRYAWFEEQRARSEVPSVLRPVLAGVLAAVRRWDLKAAGRVTRYVANSRHTQRRIRDLYGREANIVHPPVEVDRFHSGEPDDYFLTVTELVRHKRVDLAAAAATAAGQRLKVVGGGPELARLRAQYPAHVEFLGRVEDEQLVDLYAHARAAVVPNIEEFGITAVEAQAAGRPVIAPRAGGTLETVQDGITGLLVEADDVGELERTMRSLDPRDFDAGVIQQHAQRFSVSSFQARFRQEVALALQEHSALGPA